MEDTYVFFRHNKLGTALGEGTAMTYERSTTDIEMLGYAVSSVNEKCKKLVTFGKSFPIAIQKTLCFHAEFGNGLTIADKTPGSCVTNRNRTGRDFGREAFGFITLARYVREERFSRRKRGPGFAAPQI